MDYSHNSHGSIDHGTLLIDIATRNVIHFLPDDQVGTAAGIMAEKRISSIVVADGQGYPLGIVTERNMLQAMQSGCTPETVLGKIMSAPVITVPETITCLDAYQICLRDGIRHLVIVDDDKRLLGVVSETDFHLHIKLTTLAGRRQVASAMSRTLFSLPPEASLQDALNLMQSHRDTCVVVVDDERPAGIVTERDIVRLYSRHPEQTGIQLKEVMTSPVLTISLDSKINEAAEKMLIAKVRHLVVTDRAGRTAGVISEHDLTQTLALNMIDDKLIMDGAFLRTLINTIPDLVWLKDASGIYLACNSRFERFFGAKENAIVGKIDYDFLDEELAKSFSEQDRKALEANGPTISEAWIKYPADGHREFLEILRTPMYDSLGHLIGVLGVARDISERKLNENKLREQKEFLAGIFESALDAFVSMNSEGVITRWSRQAEAMFGWSREEAVGQLVHETVVPVRYREAHVRGLAHFLAAGDTMLMNSRVEIVALHRDGYEFPVELTISPIKIAEGYEFSSFIRNISDRKRAEQALRDSLKDYSELVQRIPVGVFKFRMGQDGRVGFDYVSRRWCEIFDLSAEEVMREPLASIERIHAAERKKFVRLHDEARSALKPFVWEGRIIRSNGELRWVHIESEPTIHENGDVLWDGIQYDITDRRIAEEALRITASVFDTSQEAILITDANNAIVDVNPAFTYITGYSRDEVIGRNPRLLSSGRQDQKFITTMWQSLKQNGTWRGEVWNRRKSGEIYAELLSISAICDDDGKVQRYVGVFSDISYLKEHEAELSRVAHFDALTGIPNRVLLADRLKQAIAKTARDQSMVAICYLDLDGFKFINDTMGHDAGDQVLIDVARRIGNTIRGGDTVARLGGDEFVVLLNMEKGEECTVTLERLLAVIAHPITVKGRPQMVSASIGVSIYPLDNDDSDTLLRHADQAMYLAKQSGKNCYSIYDPVLDLKARTHNEFLKNFRYGLEHNQFELYYQPKIELQSRRLVGVEALIRWNHPEQGVLSPSDFMRAIANTDIDIDIGNWVICTALAQIRGWQRAGLNMEVSINISAYHLEYQGFVDYLRHRLAEYPDIPTGRLQIEVLETVALNDLAVVRSVIEECREFGVGFSLDDFGTGYSSLSYLSKLPVDILKIDQSFVRDMLEVDGDRTIVQGIIALAKAFNRKVVAEGIETQAQYKALLDMGCEMGQGYAIAHPMPVNELIKWCAVR